MLTVSTTSMRTSEIRYTPWGSDRYTYATTPTSYRYTGQRQESSLGLYFYGDRWYDPVLGRWLSPDSIIPAQQGVMGNDRYAYVNNSPLNFVDPTGHSVDCALGEDDCGDEDPPIDIDTMELAQEILGADDVTDLRNIAIVADNTALALDGIAEMIVLGFVGVGAAGGLTFEGNPVTGIAGAGVGWILGETNPATRIFIGAGNIAASISSGASILADFITGDTRFTMQMSLSQQGISIDANVNISTNTLISFSTSAIGWATSIVEGSLALQSVAVSNDHGWFPTYNIADSFHLP